MKQLQNNFTTPEQSKRLLELGVPTDSADCYYLREHPDRLCILNDGKTLSELRLQLHMAHAMPCWSVGRLNEIFKICSDVHIEIYDLDLKGTQIKRAMQAFEEYAKYNWLDFSKLN